MLESFVVNTEKDNGYIAMDSLAGGRTATLIKLTPTAMSSLTRTFLDDVAITDVREALNFAAERIEAYHAQQRPQDHSFVDAAGLELGWRWTAVDAVGLYVPGGRASYPSSVLMNAVPARAAGAVAMIGTNINTCLRHRSKRG